MLIDIVMLLYNSKKHNDVYSNKSGSLWQYYKDLDDNNKITDFPANINNIVSMKFKQQITEKTGNGGTKNIEIMVLL